MAEGSGAPGGPGAVGVEVAGAALWLRPDGSVWDAASRTLFVTDLHLGKGAVFRARGIPVPSGDSRADLARLSKAVSTTGADAVVVLGDLAHAAGSWDAHVVDALAAWRDRHPAVDVTVVRGNHDRAAGDPPPALGFRIAREPFERGGLDLRHHPPDGGQSTGRPVLAGHLHPVVRLEDGRDRVRLPCFWRREGVLVLPAWGGFTGGAPIRPAPEDGVWVLTGGEVMAVGAGHP